MNKKLLLLLSFFALLPVAMSGATVQMQIDGLWYKLDSSNKTAEVIQWRNSIKYTGSVVIPQSVNYSGTKYQVTSIGNYAFWDCSGLTTVTIPNSVTNIGNSAFSNCSGLSTVIIPNSVTSIDNYTFYGCSGLTTVTISNSVTSIGNSAFSNCNGLTSIEIPEGVDHIGDEAFLECSSLSSISFPKSLKSIGGKALDGTPWLNAQTDDLVYIGSVAYLYKGVMPYNCELILRDGTTGIAGYAFNKCSNLASISIPTTVSSIGSYAFSGCSRLSSVVIPNGVKSIDYYTFRDCNGLTSISIPNSVTSIGSGAFYNCKSLKSISIPNTVKSIGGDAFYQSGLTSITIPNSVESIESRAFYNCSSLREVNLNEGLKTIGHQAFDFCYALNSVTIPKTVEKFGGIAFAGCTALREIVVDAENPAFDSRGQCNAIIETATNTLIAGCNTTIIPESVTALEHYAFWNCRNLKQIHIPKSIQSLVGETFRGCYSLQSITVSSDNTFFDSRGNCNAIIDSKTNILLAGCSNTVLPKDIVGIGSYAFDTRYTIKELNLPKGVKFLGFCSFQNCTGLTKVMLPESVDSISAYAFDGCKSITDMYCYAVSVPTLLYDVFRDSNIKNATLHVPAASLSAYEAADQWKEFGSIVALPDGGNTGGDEYVSTFDGSEWMIGAKGDFANLNAAMQDSRVQDGDKLYIENDLGSNDQTINKRVMVIGPGNANSAKAILDGTLVIEAEGVKVTGIRLQNVELRENHITLERCHITGSVYAADNYECDNAVLRSCYIKGLIDGNVDYPAMGWDIQNCIIVNENIHKGKSLIANLDEAKLNHNLLYAHQGSKGCIENMTHSTIKNSIITQAYQSAIFNNMSDNTFTANYLCAESLPSGNYSEDYLNFYCDWFLLKDDNESIEKLRQLMREQYTKLADDNTLCGPLFGSHPYELGCYALDVPRFTSIQVEDNSLLSCYIVNQDNYNIDVVELYWDNDPGHDQCHKIAITASDTVSIYRVKLPLEGLAYGTHTLFLRARSAAGMWSATRHLQVELAQQTQTVDYVLDANATENWQTRTFNSLSVLIDNLPSENSNERAQVSVADGNYEMYGCNSNISVPEQPTYSGMRSILETIQFVVEKNCYNMNYCAAPIVMQAPTRAVFRFRLLNASSSQALEKGFAAMTPSDQASLIANLAAIKAKYHQYLDFFISKIQATNISIYIEDKLVIGDDEFQVEPNDLLALKNMYQAWGGQQWKVKKWTFVNNGRSRDDFPGVNFSDDGRVLTIDLSDNGLQGELFAVSSPQLSALKQLNLSNNSLSGDVALLARDLQSLQELNLDVNRLSQLSEPLPLSVTQFSANKQDLTDNQPLAFRVAAKDVALPMPSLFTYNYKEHKFNSGHNVQIDENTSFYHTQGLYALSLKNSRYDLAQDYQVMATIAGGYTGGGSTLPLVLNYAEGDADLTGQTNVLDVQHTLNYILAPATVGYFNIPASNTYADQLINVQDIVATVNLVLAAPMAARYASRSTANDTAGEAEGTVYVSNGQLMLSAQRDVAAIDVELDGVSTDQVSLLLHHRDFQMVGRNTEWGSRYVIFSPTGKTLAANDVHHLLRFSGVAVPVAVQCADADATDVIMALGSEATAISDLMTEGNTHSPLYDLNGCRVKSSSTRRGIFIQDGRKVVRK